MPSSQPNVVRVQEKGQVTLPAHVRRRLGLKKGDLVTITETEDGVLITPSAVLATKALDRIGDLLRAHGATLEELIDSGREIRGQLIEEQYGLDPDRPTR